MNLIITNSHFLFGSILTITTLTVVHVVHLHTKFNRTLFIACSWSAKISRNFHWMCGIRPQLVQTSKFNKPCSVAALILSIYLHLQPPPLKNIDKWHSQSTFTIENHSLVANSQARGQGPASGMHEDRSLSHPARAVRAITCPCVRRIFQLTLSQKRQRTIYTFIICYVCEHFSFTLVQLNIYTNFIVRYGVVLDCLFVEKIVSWMSFNMVFGWQTGIVVCVSVLTLIGGWW